MAHPKGLPWVTDMMVGKNASNVAFVSKGHKFSGTTIMIVLIF